ncbi:MAG: hypothetical protein CL677_03825 [Bdellovibrionaceae bacterium]|nr:hypothetical protein [Pseudobdellovibrionaceae bacterium]|tara:strand:- start:27907 stop:28716 length:810 start_codon:yes stop_codon:yes gene_type:complete
MERLQYNIKKFVGIGGLTVVMALGFQNCSVLPSSHTGSLASLDACGEDLMVIFQNIMHPMATAQCSKCHIPGGSGKGDFAGDDVTLAFESFYAIGIDKVAQFAVDAGHNAPYTGAVNDADVAEALDEWEVIKPQCEIRGGANFLSSVQNLSGAPEGGSGEYSFTFDSAGFNGTVIRLDVEKVVNGSSVTYRFSDPEITGAGGQELSIRGLVFYLNGEYQDTALSFAGVNQVISPGVPEQFSGIEIVQAVDPVTDEVQVGFIEMTYVDVN